MSTITASMVKALRDITNVGMMECKRALVETNGDQEQAVKILRERGLAIAGKKASRSANEGSVAAEVINGGKSGVMIEVNCETDFVARNDTFKAFVKELLEKAKTVEGDLADSVQDDVAAKITEIGENIILRRNTRLDVQGPGTIASYIHLGAKVGVLVEIGCGKEETVSADEFRELAKDITLHIAAGNPQYLERSEVPEDVVNSEKEIYANQVEGKPENIVEKIVSGKLDKFFTQICLVEQGFVKDPDHTVTELLDAKGKELGDELSIRRFVRYQVGA